jgi:hypothetical protein
VIYTDLDGDEPYARGLQLIKRSEVKPSGDMQELSPKKISVILCRSVAMPVKYLAPDFR